MKQSMEFDKLFEPVRIGAIELKNRLVMLPMENNYGAEDGAVTARTRNYYEARANEVGLVIIQISCVEAKKGRAYRYQLCIDDDRFIPGLSKLAQTIHKGGAKTFIQLHHAGAMAKGGEVVAASATPTATGVVPRELTIPEIEDIISKYISAAQRAKKADFDGVEVVASGNYLVWNFLSPVWNKRSDKYGGDLAGRARLFLEIVRGIKASLGKDFPVSCRLAIREYNTPNGMTVKDAQQVARMAQDAGIDNITTTAVSTMANVPTYPGALLPLSRAIKQVVTIPVIAAGRMDLGIGETAIKEGKADLIGIGRRLLADPEYVAKTGYGRNDEVRPCIACLQCANTAVLQNGRLRCTVNPTVGREKETAITIVKTPKRVVVVGGGPAGMTAAITAAQRGHKVKLFDKGTKLGGQLTTAALPPGKSLLDSFNNYLMGQIKQLGIEVKSGKEATLKTIESSIPDVVVLATGIKCIVPKISGLDKAHVVTAKDVLNGKVEVGMEVVVIGGETTGCETAEFLVDRDRKVTIVELLDRLATKANPVLGRALLERLSKKGVAMYTGVKREEYIAGSLVIVTREGLEKTIEVNTIVLAIGGRPNNELLQTLKGKVSQIYSAGDCVEPRNIMEATAEGFNIGNTI